VEADARARRSSAGVPMERVQFVPVEYDDTWLRDSGPLTLVPEAAAGRPRLLDFRFTGWGGKFEATRDDALVQALRGSGIFVTNDSHVIDFALEGGAIEKIGRAHV